MTPREQILALLKGEQPDQVPWCGDLDYWANSLIARNRQLTIAPPLAIILPKKNT